MNNKRSILISLLIAALTATHSAADSFKRKPATSPVPSHEKQFVPTDCHFVWGSTSPPKEYKIYLSQDKNQVVRADSAAFQGKTSFPTFNPGGLEAGRRYFWRVDSVSSEDNILPGDIWSFHTAKRASDKRPNIIVILIDDLSYKGLNLHGGERIAFKNGKFPDVPFSTPRIDSIGEKGMAFNHCYTQPLCEPTRVSILSGLSNIRNFTGHRTFSNSTVTFANTLQEAGYATCLSGKWKQGGTPNANPEIDSLHQFGFEEYLAFDYGGRGNRYKNPRLVHNGVVKHHKNGEYGPDLVNRHAMKFIEKKRSKPFFLFYSMMLVHAPPSPTPDSAGTAFQDFDFHNERKREPKYYPDMVAYMDKMVGRLLDKVDQLGISEETCIILTADNGTGGGFHQKLTDGSLFPGGKGKNSEHGIRVPLLIKQPGTVPSGSGKTPTFNNDLIHLRDIYPTLCEIAGASIPEQIQMDGRSFYPQTRGQTGTPRETLFHYYAHKGAKVGANPPDTLKIYVWDQNYKLFADQKFFDLKKDPTESHPLDLEKLSETEQKIFRKFSTELKKRAYQEVDQVSLAHSDIQLGKGKIFQARATVLPANASRNGLKWTSEDAKIATVDKWGRVTAIKQGSTTIQVTSYDALSPQTFIVNVSP